MTVSIQRATIVLTWVLLALAVSFQTGHTGEKTDMKGWEAGSPYNRHYDPSEWDKLKGVALEFKEVTPLPGMSPGVALVMKDREGEIVTVHLGPKGYIDSNNIGVRKGEKITVKGVWAEIDGEDVFIGSKVTKGEYYVFKIRRTSDGKPYWTMTPEELAEQKSGQ